MFYKIRSYSLLAAFSLFWCCIGNPFDSSTANQFRLLYVSAPEAGSFDNLTLYSMNEDGTDKVVLAYSHFVLATPTWSPNAEKIAFGSQKVGNSEIFIVNSDGTSERNITNNPVHDSFPKWSPDGSKIVFTSATSQDQNGTFEIFMMNSDGSDRIQLTNMESAGSPQWSANGAWIVFLKHGATDEPLSVFAMTPDGGNVVQLIDNLQGGYDLSPDGNSLAFTKQDSIGVYNIYKLGIEGGSLEKLTDGQSNGKPVWSPDGEKIVFESWRDQRGFQELYVMNADGSNLQRITDIGDHKLYYAISPDSKKIAFTSGIARHHSWDIYTIDIDGSNLRRLTEGMGSNRFGEWSPIRM